MGSEIRAEYFNLAWTQEYNYVVDLESEWELVAHGFSGSIYQVVRYSYHEGVGHIQGSSTGSELYVNGDMFYFTETSCSIEVASTTRKSVCKWWFGGLSVLLVGR